MLNICAKNDKSITMERKKMCIREDEWKRNMYKEDKRYDTK